MGQEKERSGDKISVIVPVYKVEPYLRRCVDSILAQTHKNLEVILVDDGSPDGCPAICDEYAAQDSRVKVIHKENGGVSSARNAGLDAATGDYIGFVDSDDQLVPEMYETLLETAEGKDADVSMCGYIWVADDGRTGERLPPEWPQDCASAEEAIRATLCSIREQNGEESTVGFCWNKLYRKVAWGTVHFDETLAVGEDTLAVFQVLLRARVVAACRKPLYRYCLRPDSAVYSSGLYKSRNVYHTAEKMLKTDDLKPEVRQLCVENFVAYLFCYINWLARESDYTEYKTIRRVFQARLPEIWPLWSSCRMKYKVGLFLLRFAPGVFWSIMKGRTRR